MVKKKMLRKTKMFIRPVLLLYIRFLGRSQARRKGVAANFSRNHVFFVISGQKFIWDVALRLPLLLKPLPALALRPFLLYSNHPRIELDGTPSQDFSFTGKPPISYIAHVARKCDCPVSRDGLAGVVTKWMVRAVGKTVYAWKSPQRNASLQAHPECHP
jgi:hypothetical protein